MIRKYIFIDNKQEEMSNGQYTGHWTYASVQWEGVMTCNSVQLERVMTCASVEWKGVEKTSTGVFQYVV